MARGSWLVVRGWWFVARGTGKPLTKAVTRGSWYVARDTGKTVTNGTSVLVFSDPRTTYHVSRLFGFSDPRTTNYGLLSDSGVINLIVGK